MKKVFNISTKSSETDTNKPSKKRKVFKTLGFSSLALLMGAAGVFAFAPLGNAPMSPNTLNASATTQGQTFDLGLDPQNDPVVYTTESGLEIKKSNGKYSSTTTVTTNKGVSSTQDLTSFYYFTMGTFSGTIYTVANADKTAKYTLTNEPVNWLIIGRGPGFNFEKSTPAGTGIVNDRDKEEIATSALNLPNFFTTVPEHSDIPEGCMLVLSEKLLGQSGFNGGTTDITACGAFDSVVQYSLLGNGWYGTRYRYKADAESSSYVYSWTNKTSGQLYTYINNLFSKNNGTGSIEGNNKLGFTQVQADIIVPQQLYTYYHGTQETPSTDGGTYYTMFPLASKLNTYQNFCIEDYLTTQSTRLATLIGSTQNYNYWLRTPNTQTQVKNIAIDGFNSGVPSFFLGVRPAMVIRLA